MARPRLQAQLRTFLKLVSSSSVSFAPQGPRTLAYGYEKRYSLIVGVRISRSEYMCGIYSDLAGLLTLYWYIPHGIIMIPNVMKIIEAIMFMVS